MAYRIKGMLTKKEREGLISFVQAYNDVLDDEAVDKDSREALRKGFTVIVICIRIILYADNNAILGRVIGTMRNGIRQVSKKRGKKLKEYNKLAGKLRTMYGNKSELSGSKPTWEFGYKVEPHYIMGRNGEMLTSSEHTEQDGNTNDEKLALLAFIRPRRLEQGFEQTTAYINAKLPDNSPHIRIGPEKIKLGIEKAGNESDNKSTADNKG